MEKFNSQKFGYKTNYRLNGKPRDFPEYGLWKKIHNRSYNPEENYKTLSYIGCSVADVWFDYQELANFWHMDEYRKDGWHLDKDILVKGNKVYSPDTCVFVPPRINGLFCKSLASRGDLPIGVGKSSEGSLKPYTVRCKNAEGKATFLGTFHNPLEGFPIYKQFKESVIKDVANEYRSQISDKLYNALLNYKIEITD